MKNILPLLIALLALPCGAAEKAKKQEDLLSQQSVSAHSIDEAITKSQPVALAPGKKVKRAITQKNPVLETDGRRVLYDVYSLTGKSGQSFDLMVMSICKCFGFDKTIIVPTTLVLSDGKLLATQIHSEGKMAAGLTPLHYETQVSGTFDRDGLFHVLIYGDTGEVGSTVVSVDGGAVLAPGAMTTVNIGTFDITKSPVGNITIELLAP